MNPMVSKKKNVLKTIYMYACVVLEDMYESKIIISTFNKLNCIANIAYLLHVGSRKILTRPKIRVDRPKMEDKITEM